MNKVYFTSLLTNGTIFPRVSGDTAARIVIHPIGASGSIFAWSLDTIICILNKKNSRLIFLLCWNTYILLVSRWQNIPTYTAVLSCVSGDTVTIVVIHSIGTSCTILARSQCTIIYILSKRFLSLKFCLILIIFWFNFNYCSC